MASFISLLILALAVSLDSFGVGMTYGLRKMTIPVRSILIISFCSGLMILIAMSLGRGMSLFFTPQFAEALGAFILIGLGLWVLCQISLTKESQEPSDRRNRDAAVKEKEELPVEKRSQEEETVQQGAKLIWSLEIRRISLVIQVLGKPMLADLDSSGVITSREALVLGLALALDAFGAGIGAALVGFSPWSAAPLIALMSGLHIYLGTKFGVLFAEVKWFKKTAFFPGIILIALGVFKLL